MKYIDATKGSAIALVVFVLLVYFVPGAGPSGEVELILTVSTFLFAIIVGFYLSRLNNRYDKMRELIASEDSSWLSLYQESAFLGPEFQSHVREIIDSYYVSAYDFRIGEHKTYTERYIQDIYKELASEQRDGFKAENAFDKISDLLKDLQRARNEVTVVTLEKLTMGQCAILLLLSGIILFCLFYLKIDVLYSQVIVILLSTVLVLLLLLLRDLQNFLLGGKSVVEESGQQVFDSIGKLRYYPEVYLAKHNVHLPWHVKEHRVGHHVAGEAHKMEIRKASK